MKTIEHIFVHADCPDGLASAMILATEYPEAKVQFIKYGAPEFFQAPVPGVIWCDMSPPQGLAEEWIRHGAICLDHHIGAKEVTQMFQAAGQGLYSDDPGVSGAVLALRWVVTEYGIHNIREDFVKLAGIRDTWQKDHPLWEKSCHQAAALMFYGPENLLPNHVPWLTDDEMRVGKIMHTRRLAKAREIADTAAVFEDVLIFNDREALISDVAEAARSEVPRAIIAAGFFYRHDTGDCVVSLRSIDQKVDVMAIAKVYGGGGHTKAAGFTIKGRIGDALYVLPRMIRGA